MALQLVQGDLTPVIELAVSGLDLTGKTLQYWVSAHGSCEPLKLEAFLQEDGKTIHVPLTAQATANPGTFYAQLVVVGEMTVYDKQTIVIRARCA
ncbi:hypothetical protein ERD78_18890 [Allopusillimonas soli]|uniref:Uncharacterized protein n=1 Tax=Allopusillimonas soli TaxID=659016 RepID=A0A853FDF6_9BURK|nr:hypothetical protein [Allopusillimonas soli]NYT38865.1 hypothetical protein [Allopusillimonas soli]TEA70136.1 hypothetical protein ERD78_18890 [Allopusillimonas soli]